jgi:hypothetical protein
VRSSLVALALVTSAACTSPKQDDFRSEGGISPDPTGVIEGSIIYLGPKPRCEYTGKRPTGIVGVVFLTLFEFDNAPPPEGRATGAVNAFVLPGDQLFTLGDCLADGADPDPEQRIMRSASFTWPQIALRSDAVDYQIRGFYDHDGDVNPLFGVTNQPTAGDVVGAALKDVESPQKGPERLRFAALDKARDGELLRGVTVALGSYVWSERPMFELAAKHRVLDANAFLPAVPKFEVVDGETVTVADVPATLRAIHQLTCENAPATRGCGVKIQTLDEESSQATFEAAGLTPSFDSERYAFFSEPVDVKTIRKGAADLTLPDGQVDPHPLLGSSLGLPWISPMTIFSRLAIVSANKTDTVSIREASAFATQARIPGVTMVGSVMPDAVETKRVFVDSLDIGIPPIAAVDLLPTNPACRVPYAAPGNFTTTFESRFATCAKLPTGMFGMAVLAGVASGEREEVEDTVSESGVHYVGTRFAGQSWTIPNELGSEVQVGADALPSQSAPRLFFVTDRAPETEKSCTQAPDPTNIIFEGGMAVPVPRDVKYKKVCKNGESPFAEDANGIDSTQCLPKECCDNIAHLCKVPLCPEIEISSIKVRANPTEGVGTAKANGAVIPSCIPFLMPSQCCSGD